MDKPLAYENFTAYVGKGFNFEGHPLTLILSKVDLLPEAASPGSPRTPFALVFAGPPGVILPAGLYRAIAGDGTKFDLHIMPIHTPGRDRQDYQAVFN